MHLYAYNKTIKYTNKMKTTFLRGLPGSGKSTLAKRTNAKHIEADMFFYKNGIYHYDKRKIRDAHIWCQSQTKYYLNQGCDVVVSNTFVTIKELRKYIEIAKDYKSAYKIIECKNSYGSIHGVPAATINNMRNKWEVLPKKF